MDVPPRPLYKTGGDPIFKRVRGTVERVEKFVGDEAGGVGTAGVFCKRAASAANSFLWISGGLCSQCILYHLLDGFCSG